jgi:hypothetical protein
MCALHNAVVMFSLKNGQNFLSMTTQIVFLLLKGKCDYVETPIGCKQLQYTFVRTSADSGVE